MTDLIITGASRGIGHALALALAARAQDRLLLVARDQARLDTLVAEVARKGGRALAVAGDLSSLADARALGERLANEVSVGATLIHNAGIWPAQRALTPDGLETAFVVNHLAPLALQRPLLEAGLLRRIMVVSAGLIAIGRFDPLRTATGGDFSRIRTYCSTKLCQALAMRDVAAAHPEVDVVVLHPGVVNTELGASSDVLGFMLSLVKRRLEAPEICAARLVRILDRAHWSPAGEASWLFEEKARPWPAVAQVESTRRTLRECTERLLGASA